MFICVILLAADESTSQRIELCSHAGRESKPAGGRPPNKTKKYVRRTKRQTVKNSRPTCTVPTVRWWPIPTSAFLICYLDFICVGQMICLIFCATEGFYVTGHNFDFLRRPFTIRGPGCCSSDNRYAGCLLHHYFASASEILHFLHPIFFRSEKFKTAPAPAIRQSVRQSQAPKIETLDDASATQGKKRADGKQLRALNLILHLSD